MKGTRAPVWFRRRFALCSLINYDASTCQRWTSSTSSFDAPASASVSGAKTTGPGARHARWPASVDVREAVHAVVESPLQEEKVASSASATVTDANEEESQSIYKVHIADKFGMPADLPREAPQSFHELLELCPSILREQVQAFQQRHRWHTLTPVQKAAISFILEYRDLLCIAPTATGKTFAYAFPTVLRLLLDGQFGRPGEAAGEGADLNRQNVEALIQDKISSGEICRYCELSIAEHRVCPMTGTPHPRLSDMDALSTSLRRPTRLDELTTQALPRVLVLVPTSQLAFQVYGVYRQMHGNGYQIRYMVRASNPEEQRRHLSALEGCDILISTPETILPALLKSKLSLKRVKTIVLDEVDDLVSTNHMEKVKIILGALPKGHDRPQRLLFGATLPPVAYQMIRERMLQPSHRFVLADVRVDNLGHPVTMSSTCRSGLATSNVSIKHIVLMVSRVEKIDKLAWLYKSGSLSADQRTLIFCNSRNNVAYVRDRLQVLVPDLHITTLTSHASVTAREGVLKMFQKGASTCLVCTDILSRGVDMRNVVSVVNYDMPTEMEVWVHRCGRCGRHGMPGYAYTLFQPENVKLAKPLVAFLRQSRQLIPAKLQEYAKQSFVDVFKSSLFHHPTRPYRRNDPQLSASALGRGVPRFPDYRQEGVHKHFRPQ